MGSDSVQPETDHGVGNDVTPLGRKIAEAVALYLSGGRDEPLHLAREFRGDLARIGDKATARELCTELVTIAYMASTRGDDGMAASQQLLGLVKLLIPKLDVAARQATRAEVTRIQKLLGDAEGARAPPRPSPGKPKAGGVRVRRR